MLKLKSLIAFSAFFLISIGLYAQELSVYSGLWSTEYYKDNTEITKEEFKSLLLGYDTSKEFWRKKIKNETWMYASFATQAGFMFWTINELEKPIDNRDVGAPLGLLGSLIINTIFFNATVKNGKKAILSYNKQFDNKTASYQLIPVSNAYGSGIALRF